MTIKVEEPIFLTIQAGRSDEHETEINELRAELSSLHRQLRDSHMQLDDTGGNLRSMQEQLAKSPGALSIERQRTMDLSREIRAMSRGPSPLPGAGGSGAALAALAESEDLIRRSRSWADKDSVGNRAGHPGYDKAAAGQVRKHACCCQ